MKRLTLFVKGNLDVHDSLHSCRLGGKVVWNGLNEALRVTHPDWKGRIKHETWTGTYPLLNTDGTVPPEVTSRNMSLGPYSAECQYSRAIFETKADAIILSIQPDMALRVLKHKEKGFLFFANAYGSWTEEDKKWLADEFVLQPRLEVEESMANFTTIIEQIRERTEAPILVYNLSPIVPGEVLHCYQGLDELYSTRIRKFNLSLIELSQATGISVIDVETLLARKGAEALKLDATHLAPEGYRLIAEEVVRVLADLGVLT